MLVAQAEYAHLPRQSFRTDTGHRVLAYFTDDGHVYVKTFGDTVRIDKVTDEQWENAVLNHGLH